MLHTGRQRRRLIGALTVAIAAAISGCAGASPSATASLTASSSASPSAVAGSPTAAASEVASPPGLPTSSSNLFSLLPTTQPADYVPQIACSGTIGPSDPVAIVRMEAAELGAGPVVLRDYADPAKPMTVCTLGSERIDQLIDARHVVISANDARAVVDLPELRYHWFQVAYPKQFLAVGPKLDRVVWAEMDPVETETDTIHLTTAAGDKVIATLPDNNMGRCGSVEFDSNWTEYTPSGSHFFVLDQPLPETVSLIVVAGETTKLSILPPSTDWPEDSNPMMALWSPTSETLYYRQGGDIWRWTDGSDPELFLPDVAWVQPTISSDGAHLAYAVTRPEGLHDTYLVDLTQAGSPTPQKIGDGPRRTPVFLNATQLWFKSEGDDYGCAGTAKEQPLIYDIVDRVEFHSIIEQPLRVWPGTSSNL